ncbi:probasin-like isoform X1 [Microtus oregoni]|uniref:probasin-like isoform X1 n=1 Tax=Microtus oregoni TaxID=111838 RepID=UPI001BB17485|nr:probasin-like isoform X1 [Microtus oregoni]
MKVAILLLMLNLLGVSSVMMNKNLKKKIEGNWQTVYLASSSVEKIKEGSPLRTYFRRIECGKKCKQIYLYFYVNCSLGIGDSTVAQHVPQIPGLHPQHTGVAYMANIPGLGEWRKGTNCQKYEIIGKKRQEFYQAQYEGKITFMVKMVNEKILLFHYFNKDHTGKVTRVAGILAKAKQLTKDEMTQYMDFVEEIGIEDENVQRVLDTDTCPKKIKTR